MTVATLNSWPEERTSPGNSSRNKASDETLRGGQRIGTRGSSLYTHHDLLLVIVRQGQQLAARMQVPWQIRLRTTAQLHVPASSLGRG